MAWQSSTTVTPHDTNLNEYDALFVEEAGDVTFVTKSGTTDTWNVAAGTYILVAVKIVKDTGTDAIVIHGLR